MFSSQRIIALTITLLAVCGAASAEVRTLKAPGGGQVPDVVQDGDGVWHMTYGVGQPGNGFYTRSSDAGKSSDGGKASDSSKSSDSGKSDSKSADSDSGKTASAKDDKADDKKDEKKDDKKKDEAQSKKADDKAARKKPAACT